MQKSEGNMYRITINHTIDGECFDIPAKTFQTREAADQDFERIKSEFQSELACDLYRQVGANADIWMDTQTPEGTEVLRRSTIKRPKHSPYPMTIDG